jgi:hypothetical protein
VTIQSGWLLELLLHRILPHEYVADGERGWTKVRHMDLWLEAKRCRLAEVHGRCEIPRPDSNRLPESRSEWTELRIAIQSAFGSTTPQ